MSSSTRDSSNIDPLYIFFEKHLYDFHEEEENSVEFIDNIVRDYLNYLQSKGVGIPKKWYQSILEELRCQVRTMLVKKTYGCLSMEDFLKKEHNLKDKRKSARKKASGLR